MDSFLKTSPAKLRVALLQVQPRRGQEQERLISQAFATVDRVRREQLDSMQQPLYRSNTRWQSRRNKRTWLEDVGPGADPCCPFFPLAYVKYLLVLLTSP
jgi:hypothetical protein